MYGGRVSCIVFGGIKGEFRAWFGVWSVGKRDESDGAYGGCPGDTFLSLDNVTDSVLYFSVCQSVDGGINDLCSQV